MRRKTIIFLLFAAVVFVVAGTDVSLFRDRGARNMLQSVSDTVVPSVQVVTLSDLTEGKPAAPAILAPTPSSSLLNDSIAVDSLKKAIAEHNRLIDDSIRQDSIQRAKSNGIEAPVEFSAEDSLVYDATSKTAFLYGKSKVDYQNMKLASDKVAMGLDSNIVRATGSPDSTVEKGLKGTPVFSMGKDKYESDTMAFNFKTKKGLINNVYTEQEDGFLRGKKAKRNGEGVVYIEHGRYTTCDLPHPDFYISLSRAKVRPGKDVVFGPAHLVVADVPVPLAIPYGFFPFSKHYSSGFIMPTYGDESTRGFYLRDGGYYFAINDKWDLKLLGEIYTKGSWGISAASNYKKRYRYSGSFFFSYQNTKTGDKGMPDYAESTSFKLQWQHRQDQKANPFSTLSASVNFASSSYETNNLTSMYNPQAMTQSTRSSSVNWSTGFSSLGLTLSTETNILQNMRDSSVTVTLPELNVSMSSFYPFKRKKAVGSPRWYEKIQVKYTGRLSNSIVTKENRLFKSNLVKDWRNGMQHTIPIQGNFTLFKYINVTPNVNFVDRMYTSKVERSWDVEQQKEVCDTLHGFYNVYNWSLGISASTKIYGFWTPSRKIFGDKISAIRHVISPGVSFSYAPDFGSSRYGYWKTYLKTDANGNVSLVDYSLYQGQLFGTPSQGKSGTITMSLSNNLEMKVKSDKDSTGYKKISLIDNLGLSMSYNTAAKVRPWSDLSMDIRLRWWKNYTFNMHAVFATYAYELDENGRPYVGTHTEWGYGRFGRFLGFSQSFSLTLNPEKLKKWFGGGDDSDDKDSNNDDYEGRDTDIESNIDDEMERGKNNAKKKNVGSNMAETDNDGYMLFNMPWSLTLGYGITMRENTSGEFNKKTMRYPYKFSHTLNVAGNVRISDGWNINIMSGYDFENHALSMTTASLSRDLHCFNMSCSVVLAPYKSYNFSFRCNAATLTDALKYDKRSGVSNAVKWY